MALPRVVVTFHKRIYFQPLRQTKKQARDALVAELAELNRYPERSSAGDGPAIIQYYFRFKVARALYAVLSKYNYTTIETINLGDQLNAYELNYYNFENKSLEFEEIVIDKIIKQSYEPDPQEARFIYEYCLKREMGLTQKQIFESAPTTAINLIQEGDIIYQNLKGDPFVKSGWREEINGVDKISNLARQLIHFYSY